MKPGEGSYLPDEGNLSALNNNLDSWLHSVSIDGFLADASGVTVRFAPLSGNAVGQAAGTTITLDDNAAGYNWFVDATPADNSEFLPTSNPNEWIAKADSEATGKMDMLSVLLHEYGHALGIEHNADSGDYMATTLQPGVRRLPSTEELALMAKLIGEIKSGQDNTPDTPINPSLPIGTTLSALLVGRLRRTAYGSWSPVFDSVQVPAPAPRFEIAANPTLADSKLESGTGWETQGSVSIGNGAAILSETSTSQTRLNQVFIVGEHDRYLSFTVAGIDLDDQMSGPDDAFEAGLLDANSGASLAGTIGLTHSDALLNLQADGSEFVGQGITSTANADGSRTYRIDLSGIPAGTAVNLSFDLIGFGPATSQVTVRDIRIGIPEAHDDIVAILEDTPLAVAALANDLDADQPGFVPVVVAGPTHGTVTLNTDGSFSYVPEANYYGDDSFTYNLTDGAVDSNIATVSISIVPVNDAPVVQALSATTAEDTPFTLDLLAQASDVDNPVLTPAIVAGPQHGTLIQSADGSVTYTPEADYSGTDSFTYMVNDGELDSNVATVSLAITPVNDAPMAGDQSLSIDEDTPLTGSVLAAATDIDSVLLQGSIIAGPQHGQVSVAADGSFTYTPYANYNGSDSFTYKVNDGELDSNSATVSISIAPVNDAPTLADGSADTLEDTPVTLSLLANAGDVDGDALSIAIASGPAHGTLTATADGTYTYLGAANYNGADSFSYFVTDGQADSRIATISFSIAAVNDAPVALSLTVNGSEDTPYVFNWADFGISDVDSTELSIVVNSLPLDGELQRYDGSEWVAVVLGEVISRAAIEAGWLCFGPDAGESGFDGYASTGTGNLKRDYASFSYQGSDGALLGNQATLTIDIAPVADTPTLVLIDPPDETGANRERFNTSWETVANRNQNRALVTHSPLEGWNALTEDGSGGDDGFVVWSSGDRMKDAGNHNQAVYAATGDGANWLELGDTGVNHQGFGIERAVLTRAQASYTLTFDYAGRLGYDAEHARIGVYLDGVRIGTYANTSPNTSLNWQTVSFQFTGMGTQQNLRIAMEGTGSHQAGERGAMIDDIHLVEELPLNTGYSDSPIRLSAIVTQLADADGSETLNVSVGAIPAGAVLSDGAHSFTATVGGTSTDVTVWDLDHLSITPPQNFTGTFQLTISAQATEAVTIETAGKSRTLTVTVLPANISSPLVLDLGGDGINTVSLANSTGAFDLLNTGVAIASGWISAEDAFLAIDVNGNGVIDDRSELFGGAIGEGFAKLARFDSNQDGVVDANDARFAELLVWQDRNGNHRTDAGELSGLAARGILGLSTRYTLAPVVQSGNWLLEHGTVTLSGGGTVALVDAYFEIGANDAAANPAAPLAKREEENRAASIVVSSRLPRLPTGPMPIFGAGYVSRPIGYAEPTQPVIDWSATPYYGAASSDELDKSKKARKARSWLADTLGLSSPVKGEDLAQRTGLKVVLDRKGSRHG